MQGLLLIDKPKGVTSFAALSKIKRLCNTKRVGHTGTLDPMATGVLPVLVGRATLLCDDILSSDKEYTAVARLGIKTDTLDITGNILRQIPVNTNRDQLLTVMESFKGKIMQVPPMFSAIKKNGVKLYELARSGREIKREPRCVNIKDLELISFEKDLFSFRVCCSKGTYIRSLVDDIGEALGTGAVLTDLRRTKTAGFSIENCVELEKLNEENINDFIISEEQAVINYKQVFVTQKQAIRFLNGGALDFSRLPNNTFLQNKEVFRVKYKHTLLGLGIADVEKSALKVKCLTTLSLNAD